MSSNRESLVVLTRDKQEPPVVFKILGRDGPDHYWIKPISPKDPDGSKYVRKKDVKKASKNQVKLFQMEVL